jgi:hypothetical protein
MRNLFAKFALLTLILTSVPVLMAQDSSSMTGVVSDTTGALVPGAVVTLTNPSTGVSYTKTTDNLGSYRFASVPAGTGYKVTFTHDGFSTASVSEITLNVGVTRTQNVILSVGGESQTIAVSAGNENVTINTTDAAIGNNIDVNELNDLPVYDRTRGISTLMYQQPGVDLNQGSVTGARVDQSEVTVDGLDVDDLATGETFYTTTPAPVDSVAQFTGSVGGLDSGVGTGSGGQFQLVTKNGTNKFHGNVNEYHRDTDIVANPWFNNLNRLPRTPLIRNQFGGNIGGPAKRDKLFFFFNWAQSRIVQSSTTERTVPLPASYGGLLAGTLNYINSNAGCSDSSRINTQPSCITTLSSSALKTLDPNGIGLNTSVLSYISGRYPVANDLSRGDGVNTGGYRFTYPTPNNNINYVTRIDYNLTPTQKIFGKFDIQRQDSVQSLPEFPKDPQTHPFQDRSYDYVISHQWTIGKNKTNALYYGDQISKLNFPDLYNPLGAQQPSFSGLDGPFTSFDGQKRRVPVPVVRDDFEWQKGNHDIVFGGSFKWIKTNSNLISDFNFPGIGLLGASFSNGLCGPAPGDCDPTNLAESLRPSDINQGAQNVGVNDYDNLFATGLGILGEVNTNYSYDNKGHALAAGAGTPRAYRFYQTEAYFGDSWKIKHNLTFTYGVRYQFYSVPFETKGFESVPTPIPLNTFIVDRLQQQNAGNTSPTGLPLYSYVLGGKANNGPALYQPNYKDFAPRVALAWTPYANGKTVFNLGGGIYYDRSIIDAIDFLQDQISYLFFNSTNVNYPLGGAANAYEAVKAAPRVGTNLTYPNNLNPAPQAITTPYTPYVDSTGYLYGLAAGQTSFVISPTLKDPYSIVFNLGMQQEFPGKMLLKINYVGRLGRRLLADADANQVIDVPDYTHKSTQSMSQAFAALTAQLRTGISPTKVTAQPWFENVPAAWGPAFGYKSNTAFLASNIYNDIRRGDMADALYTMAYFSNDDVGFGLDGLLPVNIGIPAQFGTNAYLTNMGSSNYHGLLVTLDKNLSDGLRFEFNYSWSHSIDNTSVSANSNALFTNSNFICDILHPRACRGDSDFDIRQEITSNFIYDLPFGRGKQFGGSMSRGWDEAVGGWEISAIPDYRTGIPQSATADAYLASFDNLDNAIFTGSRADLKSSVNINRASKTVYLFPGGSAGANKVLSEFRGPLGIEYGQRNLIRGPGGFFMDAGLGKKFPILEDKLNLNFRCDAYNVLNHPVFGGGSTDIVTSASNFGQITSTTAGLSGNTARVAQLSLRLEF